MTELLVDAKIAAVRALITRAVDETWQSVDWYAFRVMPIRDKYRTEIEGDFVKRRWWFVLRSVD